MERRCALRNTVCGEDTLRAEVTVTGLESDAHVPWTPLRYLRGLESDAMAPWTPLRYLVPRALDMPVHNTFPLRLGWLLAGQAPESRPADLKFTRVLLHAGLGVNLNCVLPLLGSRLLFFGVDSLGLAGSICH